MNIITALIAWIGDAAGDAGGGGGGGDGDHDCGGSGASASEDIAGGSGRSHRSVANLCRGFAFHTI